MAISEGLPLKRDGIMREHCSFLSVQIPCTSLHCQKKKYICTSGTDLLMNLHSVYFTDFSPSVKQTQGPTDDLHLFTSKVNRRVMGNCTVDVTLTPPAGSTGKYRFCFFTFLPK